MWGCAFEFFQTQSSDSITSRGMKVNASFPSFPFQHARLRNSARALWEAYLTLSSSIPRTSARHRSCWSSPGLYKVKEALFAKDSGVVRGGIQRRNDLKSCDVEQENNPIRIPVLSLHELNEAMLEEQRKIVQEKLHLKSIPR